MTTTPEAIKKYMSEIGRKGGKAGKGHHTLTSEDARARANKRWRATPPRIKK